VCLDRRMVFSITAGSTPPVVSSAGASLCRTVTAFKGFRVLGGAEGAGSIPASPTMRTFRRGLLAFIAAGVIAAAIRLRGRGGVPPQRGGWRELSGSDLS
jgi:hypothetical protein